MIAKDIMTRAVRVIGPGDDVRTAARIMADSEVSALPVVDDAQRVLGMVSEGDLMRRKELRTTRRRSWWLDLLTSPETLADEYTKSHSLKIHDVMTRPAICVAETTPVGDIVSTLEQHRIKRVPVLKSGHIVGIVSRADVLRAFAAQDQTSQADTSDHAIRQTFLQRFKSQVWAPSSTGISVSVQNGVVTLNGVAPSDEQQRALGVMAQTIPGVAEVRNETVVLKGIAMAT
jgi:CBS domain-containing protein